MHNVHFTALPGALKIILLNWIKDVLDWVKELDAHKIHSAGAQVSISACQ